MGNLRKKIAKLGTCTYMIVFHSEFFFFNFFFQVNIFVGKKINVFGNDEYIDLLNIWFFKIVFYALMKIVQFIWSVLPILSKIEFFNNMPCYNMV